MRWLSFILCSAIVLTLQSAIAPRCEILGARPDRLLVIVVVFAMHALPHDAVLGAWGIGACADLMTIERPGLLALSYTLTALCVAATREYFFRYRARTQFFVTLTACLLTHTAWLVYQRVLYDPRPNVVADFVTGVLAASLYTAAWAPLTHKLFLRMSRTFGIGRPRYTYAGLHRLDAARV